MDEQAMVKFHTRITELKACVVGDLMLDEYLIGDAGRISPEAPVPVVCVSSRETRPGGAANVAANLAALGVSVQLAGIIGTDDAGQELLMKLDDAGVNTADILQLGQGGATTVKSRVVAGTQQIVRIDREQPLTDHQVSSSTIQQTVERILRQGVDVLVISDYNKGTVTAALCSSMISLAKSLNIPVFVDPKQPSLKKYRGATAVTPNQKELEQLLPTLDGEDRYSVLTQQLAQFAIEKLFVTLGPNGMECISAKGSTSSPSQTREVFDVSGAGDTALAALAAAHAAGLCDQDAMTVANEAAGIAVSRTGTATVTLSELMRSLRQDTDHLSLDELTRQIEDWKQQQHTIVFTNGCFDLLHAGHMKLLTGARKLGSKLVVGVNSDASVKRLKGPSRPIVSERERARMLAAFSVVDAVSIFDADTPLELINAIRPHVLVKGGDYQPANIVGSAEVTGYGGSVITIPLEPGRSTTQLTERLAKTVELT